MKTQLYSHSDPVQSLSLRSLIPGKSRAEPRHVPGMLVLAVASLELEKRAVRLTELLGFLRMRIGYSHDATHEMKMNRQT